MKTNAILNAPKIYEEGFAELLPNSCQVKFSGKFVPLMKEGDNVKIICPNFYVITGNVHLSTPEVLLIGGFDDPPKITLVETAGQTFDSEIPVDLKGEILLGSLLNKNKTEKCQVIAISPTTIKFISSQISKDTFTMNVEFPNPETFQNSDESAADDVEEPLKQIQIKVKPTPRSLLFGERAKYDCDILEGNIENLYGFIRQHLRSLLEPFSGNC